MHKVQRNVIPESLRINSSMWTRELLDHISLAGDFSKVPKVYINRYKQSDIKDSLKDMYKGLCCYCESPIGVQTYEHIEHLKPKSIFNDKCFDWNNLHLSCEVCNVSYKKDKWNYENPILNPTEDDISLYLKIDLDTGIICPIENNERAITTIEHVGLNREELIKRRFSIINTMKSMLDNCEDRNKFCSTLEALTDDMGYKLLFDTFIKTIKSGR